jgi:uncharacterized membrane protein YjfL (UPF0719 family)
VEEETAEIRRSGKLARLVLQGTATGDVLVREEKMRRIDGVMGSFLWAAVAVLLPMAALEPVTAVAQAPEPALALAACDDGSENLAMGCAGATL